MDPTIKINERIAVATTYAESGDISTLCIPHRIKWRGNVIELTELSLRHPTVAGKRMIHVFHVSDGTTDYRLEYDAEGLTWTLVALMDRIRNEELPPE